MTFHAFDHETGLAALHEDRSTGSRAIGSDTRKGHARVDGDIVYVTIGMFDFISAGCHGFEAGLLTIENDFLAGRRLVTSISGFFLRACGERQQCCNCNDLLHRFLLHKTPFPEPCVR